MKHVAALAVLILLNGATPGVAQEEDEALPSQGFAPPTTVAPPASPAFPEDTLPTKVADVPGTWDLSQDGTNRRCVMTLLRERGPAGQKVNFPAGCRRALPVVATVAGWLYADEAVRLVDANIRPVLPFKRRPDKRSYGATEKGESYSLVPLDIAGMRPPGSEPPAPEAAATTARPEPIPATTQAPATAPVPTSALPPAPVAATTPSLAGGPQPGTYVLDRFRQQGTCRLDLAQNGTVKLLPGCQDEGIEVFNPVRWRFGNGRMTMIAKRGHTIDLVANGEGGWRRDPEVGTTLVLRRADER